jgi:hypothetical protein
MKTIFRSLPRLGLSAAAWAVLISIFLGRTLCAATGEGVALGIVYDTSGSMLQKVRDTNGQLTPKHVIASRALNAILDRLQAVTSAPEGSRPTVQAGLVVFKGDHAEIAVPFGPFKPEPFRAWLKEHGQPQRGTPLGEAVQLAGDAVLKSKLARKHILVITDGMNTKGPDPTVTLPGIQRRAAQLNTPVAVHFVAFDVKASVFSGVKQLGATVLGASDEKELNSQLEFILAKKILLEDEELPSTTPKPN